MARTGVALVTGVLCALVLLADPDPGAALEVRRLKLPACDLAADRAHGRLYASLPGTAGQFGNRVVTVDPFALTINASPLGAFVGSNPGRLAIDEGATVLYVALDGAAAVRRVDLDSFTTHPPFVLGSDAFSGPLYALDLAIMPRSPGTIAVSLTGGPPSGYDYSLGVAIFDDGRPRPDRITDIYGPDVLTFSSDPARLYGHDSYTTGFEFFRMTVDAAGVRLTDGTRLFPGDFSRRILFDAGLVFTGTGYALDPETLTLAGRYLDGSQPSGLVDSDAGANRVHYVIQESAPGTFDPGSATTVLLTFDRTRFVQLDRQEIPGVGQRPRSLVRWGSNRFAFVAADDDLFLLAPSFAPCTADAACDDGNACTTDACGEGTCVHDPVVCAEEECAATRCDPRGGCVAEPISIGRPCRDDGDPCTQDVCAADSCRHQFVDGMRCANDGDHCTADFCSQGIGCTHESLSARHPDGVRCAVDNARAILDEPGDPVCARSCPGRLRRHLDGIDNAVALAFQARGRRHTIDEIIARCHHKARTARTRASALARRVKQLAARGRITPPERAARLQDTADDLRKRTREFARLGCQLPTGDE